MTTLASFGRPHVGGTYTVYACLRRGLAAHGIEVRWLDVGRDAAAVLADASWAHEHAHGEVIAPAGVTDVELAQALIEHLLEKKYDGIFVNIFSSAVATNAVRFMPPSIRRIMIVHNITPGVYAAARAIRNWVHATVGVSQRVRDDLVARHDFTADSTIAIPNAIDLTVFDHVRREANPSGPLRLLSLGRIEDAAKGVLWLPRIVQLAGIDDATLTIAGEGPDQAGLRAACAPLGDRVRFIGKIAPAEVPAVFAGHDVLIVPSRFEGFGQTIIEAMAAGCVPVASRIRGVTDEIITDGEDGLLFPVGQIGAAAKAIRYLARDRRRLAAMAALAQRSVQGRFGIARQAAAYAEVIDRVMHRPPVIAPPLPLERWSYPAGLKPGLRTRLPTPLKNLLRTWKERWAT
jgi:glycosyltransferase involved in cell wall biosynthesis